jgi:flavocytochrome c
MATKQEENQGVTRRDFVKGLAVGAAAGLVVGGGGAGAVLSKSSNNQLLPKSWSKEADVVVVGAGMAGFVAAIQASELGAKVVLIEKAPNVGGDTALSSQTIQGAWPEKAKTLGFEDSAELYFQDLHNGHRFSQKGRKGVDIGDLTMVKYYTESIGDTLTWLEKGGMQIDLSETVYGFYPKPNWQTQQRCWIASKGAIPALQNRAASSGVETITSTQVNELIMKDGRVVGVYAADANKKQIAIKARKGVILASGSFNANFGMMAEYLLVDSQCMIAGNSYSTGDSHLMVQKMGGKLRDMDLETHWFPFTARTNSPSFTYFTAFNYVISPILVNTDGMRFTDENNGYATLGRHIAREKGHIAYFVMDKTGFAAYDGLCQAFGMKNIPYIVADSVEELAGKILVDPASLQKTIETYNGYVTSGKDLEFQKLLDKATKIETGPFVALEIVPKHYTTYGGISIDDQTRVLYGSGEPIPGLYAAGTVAGCQFEKVAIYYEGGLGQGAVFGRLAAQNAVAEKPWTD